MTFDEAMAAAAKTADFAVDAVMADYARRLLTDEDDINGAIVGALRIAFTMQPVAGVVWNASVVRHRSGEAGEESLLGADILMHVELSSPSQSYSKGILIQAKRLDAGKNLTINQQAGLKSQCRLMLGFTPAAFVMDYARTGIRCASATRIVGATSRHLHALCNLTSYRFFYEFFRCTTGDPRVTSAIAAELLVPHVIHIKGEGQFSA